MTVDDVVGALIERLGLDPAKRAKVKRYYQRLEGGLLDPHGAQQAPARRTRRRPRSRRRRCRRVDGAARARAPAFLRRAEPVETLRPRRPPPPEAEDEIDRLFTGGE